MEFKRMLPNINLIFLAAQVLIIMDSQYFGRFWTLEAWLAMQQVTSTACFQIWRVHCATTSSASTRRR